MATVDAIRRVARNTGSFHVPREELGSGASRTQLSAMWAAARARNALRRRWQFAGLAAVMLVASLLTIVLLPRQAARLACLAAPRPGEKVDTLALAADAVQARAAFVAADSALQARRSAGARARAAAYAAAARGASRRRARRRRRCAPRLADDLVAELDRLIGRAADGRRCRHRTARSPRRARSATTRACACSSTRSTTWSASARRSAS